MNEVENYCVGLFLIMFFGIVVINYFDFLFNRKSSALGEKKTVWILLLTVNLINK